MSNFRELSMDEIEMVTGGSRRFVGNYQDESGTVSVYQECNGAISDVQLNNIGGDGGWLDTPRDNNSDNSGYFGTLGLSLWGSLGGSLSVDSGGNFYGGASSGFGTPITAQLGYSPDVHAFLTGTNLTVVTGNPGIPVITVDPAGNVNTDTRIIGTPSVEFSIGGELSFSEIYNQISTRFESLGTEFANGIYNWTRYGDNGIVPPSIEPQR